MTQRIAEILKWNAPAIYLYGSVTLNDFKIGWSDIDILVLTEHKISEIQAQKLVKLRQKMRKTLKTDITGCLKAVCLRQTRFNLAQQTPLCIGEQTERESTTIMFLMPFV